MTPRFRVTAVTLALPLAVACVRAGGTTASAPAALGSAAAGASENGTPAIRTDRRRYVFDDSAGVAHLTIPFTYRNDSNQPVYLPTCRGVQPPRLEKLVGDRWIVAYAPVVSFCQGVPASVGPRESLNYTMRIVAGMPGTTFVPRFIVSEVPGTYRVLWEVFGGVDGDPRRPVPVKDLLPLSRRTSNPFEIAR
jgi:hypothetical protein